ncbi:MAG: ATP-grasp domain-containing protein [Leptospirales bacterium]|nr:ATP-grasp domain-containing protein [Leptospirales bacterium]
MQRRIERVLIANRGEIARRVQRACRQLGIQSIAVYSRADRLMPYVAEADQSYFLGESDARDSYLNIAHLLEACARCGADAVHPGYGFLSENAEFAEAVAAAGLIFIGPPPPAMRAMGDKIQARRLMEARGVPVAPGYHGEDQSAQRLVEESRRVGFPLLIKASAGGGGRGIRLVEDVAEFEAALASARREASNAFGNDTVFLERFIQAPRHIEIQIFADGHGNVVHLFERECSVQRRRQKVIEEAPAPNLPTRTRDAMANAAIEAARAVGYEGAGTVEFVYSDADGDFYFLEMNTRLQVEHPVTEMTLGVDLAVEQIRVAMGEPLSFAQGDLQQHGHAIEARIYAEDPARDFAPSAGRIVRFETPDLEGLRVDAGVESGSEISIYYDAMAAKLIAWGAVREAAIDLLDRALAETVFFGPASNLEYLRAILSETRFREGRYTTALLSEQLANWQPAPWEGQAAQTALEAAALVAYHNLSRLPANSSAGVADGGDRGEVYKRLAGFRLWTD